MASPAIELERLRVRFGDVVAVHDVSFAVERGEVVALLGPNGAGKTTTVETLEGYRRPSGGAVRVLGLDPVVDHASLTERIGVMLQFGGVHPGIRPLEALRLFASYYDAPTDPVGLLHRVGLAHRQHSTWRQLSGGERQRLSLALAMVGRPDVAFLDEPTAGMDVTGRHLVRDIVREVRDAGTTVLVTTHDLDEAERTADRIVIIDAGEVVATGTPGELMQRGDGTDDVRFAAAPGLDTTALGKAVGAFVDEVAPGEYRVATAPTPSTVAALTAWLADHDLLIGDLRAGRHRLEDVFLRLTRGDADR